MKNYNRICYCVLVILAIFSTLILVNKNDEISIKKIKNEFYSNKIQYILIKDYLSNMSYVTINDLNNIVILDNKNNEVLLDNANINILSNIYARYPKFKIIKGKNLNSIIFSFGFNKKQQEVMIVYDDTSLLPDIESFNFTEKISDNWYIVVSKSHT